MVPCVSWVQHWVSVGPLYCAAVGVFLHLGRSLATICSGCFREMSVHPTPLTEGSSLQFDDTESETGEQQKQRDYWLCI